MKQLSFISNTNDNTKGDHLTVAQYCFFIYFSVMFFAKAIGLYEGQLLYNISIVIGMLFFGFCMLLSKHSVFELCWMSFLVAGGFLVIFFTDQRGFLFYMTLLVSMKGISEKRVLRTALTILGITYPVMFFLTISGTVDEIYRLHHKMGIYIICHGLGYPHPNVTHITYMILTMLILYFVRNASAVKMLKVSLILMLGNLLVFAYTFSFTGIISVTVYLVMNYALLYITRARKLLGILSQMVLPICMAFSMIGPLVIKGHLFDIINKALNTRFYLSKYFLTTQPATLFGMRFLPENLESYNYTMDCSYVYGLRQLGVIPFVILVFVWFYTIFSLYRKGKNVELAIMLGICVGGITEPFMFNTSYRNIGFIFIGTQIFELSERISSRLPAFWNKEIQMLKVGDKEVSRRALIFDVISECLEKYIRIISNYKVRCILSFATIFAFAFIGYYITVNRPTTMYVNYNINEEAEWPETMLTQEDVDNLEEQGEIVLDYIGEGSPMYAYNGMTPIVEYYRRAIATGLFTGIVGMGLIAVISGSFLSKGVCIRRRGHG